jgi:hypothetical protein
MALPKKRMLTTVNICGRQYILRAEIARFNERATAGEFAKPPNHPQKSSAGTDLAATVVRCRRGSRNSNPLSPFPKTIVHAVALFLNIKTSPTNPASRHRTPPGRSRMIRRHPASGDATNAKIAGVDHLSCTGRGVGRACFCSPQSNDKLVCEQSQ